MQFDIEEIISEWFEENNIATEQTIYQQLQNLLDQMKVDERGKGELEQSEKWLEERRELLWKIRSNTDPNIEALKNQLGQMQKQVVIETNLQTLADCPHFKKNYKRQQKPCLEINLIRWCPESINIHLYMTVRKTGKEVIFVGRAVDRIIDIALANPIAYS